MGDEAGKGGGKLSIRPAKIVLHGRSLKIKVELQHRQGPLFTAL